MPPSHATQVPPSTPSSQLHVTSLPSGCKGSSSGRSAPSYTGGHWLVLKGWATRRGGRHWVNEVRRKEPAGDPGAWLTRVVRHSMRAAPVQVVSRPLTTARAGVRVLPAGRVV